MADLEFVDPSTGAVLGSHAFGTIAAGVESTAWAIRLRYKYGQSGSGLNQNALILEVSEDGGATYRTDLPEFTLQVTSTVNTPNDPLFLGVATSARRTNRLDLPALRAGAAYNISVVFSPTLHTGAATSTYTWRLGVLYNEASRGIDLIPDAPTGVLSGLGDVTVSEWVTGPNITLNTDSVDIGSGAFVFEGVAYAYAGENVALNQTGSSGVLTAGQEYIAVLSINDGNAIVTTKGARATAGSAVQPAYPVGNLPVAVVRVPYGGVIVTGEIVVTDGRLLVVDAGGTAVHVMPGRAVMPGYYLTPGVYQALTLTDDATSIVYLSSQGVANTTAGVPLASVTAASGVLTDITDLRSMLYAGRVAGLLADMPVNGYRITGVPAALLTTDVSDAPSWGSVMMRPVKHPVRVVADADVATLSGEQTVDGVALTAGHRLLLTNQTTTTENGIWVVSASAWTRGQDADSSYNIYAGIEVYVRYGTYTKQVWIQTSEDPADQVWVVMVDLP